MPWDQSSTVSGSGQRVACRRRRRSSSCSSAMAMRNGVMASDMVLLRQGDILASAWCRRFPELECGSGDQLDTSLRREHGAVEHEVVETAVGRIAVVEPLHVLGPGPVGISETGSARRLVDALYHHRPGDAADDGAVEPHV